jgi:hypothetical protein
LHAGLVTTSSIQVEFMPEPLGNGPVEHVMCAIPSGIGVEFIAA